MLITIYEDTGETYIGERDKGGKSVELMKIQKKYLLALTNSFQSTDEINIKIRGHEFADSIRTNVHHMRKILGDGVILNKRGYGYRLASHVKVVVYKEGVPV
jgi:DNA-binding response OmpR family regulator